MHFTTPILEGILGAILFLAFRYWRRDFEYEDDHLKERILTRIIMGAGVGYLWIQMGMPNSFNTIMAGALAPEIIEAFLSRFKERIHKDLGLPDPSPKNK